MKDGISEEGSGVKPTSTCPACGRRLPARAPSGLCPACLLDGGGQTETQFGPGVVPRFEAPALEEVARLFPQLEVVRLLGAGGMGAVYQARQPALDRWVALKVLPASEGRGGNFTERFNREARALARLHHPNIVAVHEFGQAGSWHYFLMEYVDGANLRQLEKSGRLSSREALQLIPQICDALQYAHDEGVVHRDIKPENVMVDRKGRVKIADFGLAKIMEAGTDSTRLTMDGQVMGTPHYMAPEQVERPLSVDHRADIYSLGVVLYEMLKVEVDVRFDEIVLRALENDPARRYQNASEVKERVENVAGTPAPEGSATVDGGSPAAGQPVVPRVRHLRWAGLPVVVERDGEREVSFQGALAVIFIVMVVAMIGHLLVRGITGGEHAMTRVVWMAGVWTAIWAIRRTLRQEDPTPAVAAGGTVVLPPSSRLPYLKDGLMLAGLLAVVIGSHYLTVRVLHPLFGRVPPGPTVGQVAHDGMGKDWATVPLAQGGTIELVAVAEVGRAVNRWWSPSGEPLARRLDTQQDPGFGDDAKTRVRMIVRVNDLPEGADGPFLLANPLGSISSGGQVREDGKVVRGAVGALFNWGEAKKEVDVRVGVATVPWRVVLRHVPASHQTIHATEPRDPRWGFQVHGTADTVDGAQVTLVMGQLDPDWRMQVVAADTAGKVWQARMVTGSGTPGGGDQIQTCVFTGIELASVKEFRVEVRRVHWVEFRGVRLHASGKLPEAQMLRFAAVQEITFDELVDLDTGRTADYPPADPGENPLAGVGETVLRAREMGFDAAAGTEGLQVLQTQFALLDDGDWDRLDPYEVIERLHRGRFAPRILKPARADGTGRVYAFETRDGGLGLLRLKALPGNAPRATIELRRIER
jgi:predicted Ser/Thr protein kinase